jgi:hypothetical protein
MFRELLNSNKELSTGRLDIVKVQAHNREHKSCMTSQHDNDWFSASPEFSHSINGSDTDKTQKTGWGKLIEINNVHNCGREMKTELLKTPRSESTSELYRPSDRRSSAK